MTAETSTSCHQHDSSGQRLSLISSWKCCCCSRVASTADDLLKPLFWKNDLETSRVGDSLLSWFHWERLKQQPTRWLCPSSSIVVSNFGHDFYVPRLLKLVEAVELFYLSSFFWGSWHQRNFRDVGCHEGLEVAGTELRTSWSWDKSGNYLTTSRTFRPEMGWTLNSQARVKVAVDNLEVELLG